MEKKNKTHVLTWRAPQYLRHEKSRMWFIVALGLLALSVLYGIQSGAWTFSLALLVFAAAYYSFHQKPAPHLLVAISKHGIRIGHDSFPLSHLKAFWIVDQERFPRKLYLRMNSRLQPDVYVLLEDADSDEVRRSLSKYLPELPQRHEPFSDSLVRLLRL